MERTESKLSLKKREDKIPTEYGGDYVIERQFLTLLNCLIHLSYDYLSVWTSKVARARAVVKCGWEILEWIGRHG